MIYDELFPDNPKQPRPTLHDYPIVSAICALADEVRALRLLKEKQAQETRGVNESLKAMASQAANYLSQYIAPTPTYPTSTQPNVAESERVRYPWCTDCSTFHHPDHWQCIKNGGNGVDIPDPPQPFSYGKDH